MSNDRCKQIDRTVSRIAKASAWMLYTSAAVVAIVAVLHKDEYEPYFRAWSRESSFYAFSSALQYFIAGLAAFVCYWVTRTCRNCAGSHVRRPWLWLLAFLGFTYAALDEFFSIHEKMLTKLDGVTPLLKNFYFNEADDLLLISCGIGALVFTVFMYKELRVSRQVLYYYIIGLSLLLLAGLLDYLPNAFFQQQLPPGLVMAEYFCGSIFRYCFHNLCCGQVWLYCKRLDRLLN